MSSRLYCNVIGFDLDSNPGSSSAAVTRAHVHPVPSASHLPIPESGANSPASVPQPAATSAPPQPAARASPPGRIPQQPPETSAVPESPPPEPVRQPQQPAQLEVAPVPKTPPPSPELQHAHAAGRSPPPQREDISHQEPVEHSEPEDMAVILEQRSTVDAPQPSSSVEQSETDAPPRGEDLQTTTPTAEVRPASPPATEVNSGFTVITPNKAPVQDTTPPVLEENIPVPARTQVNATIITTFN